jgi:hypothetical protein
MILYCDHLGFRAAFFAMFARCRHWRLGGWRLRLLDPVTPGLPTVFAKILRAGGYEVTELDFFAGHLSASNGQAIPLAAREAASERCYGAAEDLLGRSRLIARLNAQAPRNAVALHLARKLWQPVELLLLRSMIVDALAAREGLVPNYILLHSSWPFDRSTLARLLDRPNARVWRRRDRWTGLAGSSLPLLAIARRGLRAIIRANTAAHGASRDPGSIANVSAAAGQPNLLLIQEEALGSDRSFRTQPYWLFEDATTPEFKTFVLGAGAGTPTADLERRGVFPIHIAPRAVWRQRWSSRLWFDAVRCLAASYFTMSGAMKRALRIVAALHLRAFMLFAAAKDRAVRVLMTCENYLPNADAALLAARDLGATTVSYQYANIAISTPFLMTPADLMVTFSPTFNPLWVRSAPRPIGPARFESDGYLFDSSFGLLRGRAREHRAKLERCGARFILCYLDESVVPGKYGLIDENEHRAEVVTLTNLLLSDPDVGLIVKSQFEHNSPTALYGDAPELVAARATGRYVELVHGTHRNVVFPAEAAIASDMVIGHLVGGTAPLETALAGARAVMLNPYRVAGQHFDLYNRANILFPSLEDALQSIAAYRAGRDDMRDLGDWTSILADLDAYRDGRAGHRMRARLDALLSGSVSTVAPAPRYGSEP